MRLLFLGLTALALYAQTPPSPAAPALPANWYGAFASYNSGASPKVAAGAAEASLVSSTQQIYSYSSWDLTLIKQPKGSPTAYTYQSTPSTGFGIILKKLGNFYLLGLGTMGVATTGTNASLATSTGGMLIFKPAKSNWTVFGGYRLLYSGALAGSQVIPGIGIGRVF